MRRGALGILCGLLCWYSLWSAFGWALARFFPKHFNSGGSTESLILNLIIVLLSFDFSFISGYINAIIARNHQLRFAAWQAALQLAAGGALQAGHWARHPIWFHIMFLSFIVPAVMAGAMYRKANDNEELS